MGSNLQTSQPLSVNAVSLTSARRSLNETSDFDQVTLDFHDVVNTPDNMVTDADRLVVTLEFIIRDDAVAIHQGMQRRIQ